MVLGQFSLFRSFPVILRAFVSRLVQALFFVASEFEPKEGDHYILNRRQRDVAQGRCRESGALDAPLKLKLDQLARMVLKRKRYRNEDDGFRNGYVLEAGWDTMAESQLAVSIRKKIEALSLGVSVGERTGSS